MVTGETYNERSKGKDVRTSNIVAAKVRKHKEMSEGGARVFVNSILLIIY